MDNKGCISVNSAEGRAWFYDIDGTQRVICLESKTIYMPWYIEPMDYSSAIRSFMQSGWVVQLEII